MYKNMQIYIFSYVRLKPCPLIASLIFSFDEIKGFFLGYPPPLLVVRPQKTYFWSFFPKIARFFVLKFSLFTFMKLHC